MEEEVQQFDREAFESALVKEWAEDFTAAQRFLDPFHKACVDAYERYHNALQYENLKKSNKFPTTLYQEQIDNFVSYVMDKLFYKNRPCTVVGTEDTDQPDADAKQEMLDWQDYKDRIYNKIESLVRDAAMYRICVAQVDYTEKTRREVVGEQVPMQSIDDMGNVVTQVDMMGKPIMRSRTTVQEVVEYRGPTVKRIDPLNFFISEDKSTLDDEFPLLIREYKGKQYFLRNRKKVDAQGREHGYFFNVEKIGEVIGNRDIEKSGADTPDNIYSKRMAHGLRPEQQATRKNLEYVEWHGMVNKKKLYEYLGKPTEVLDETTGQMTPVCDEDEKCLVIGGMIERKLLVRLEETPFDFQRPNVVVGVIQGDEDELIGTSLTDKISAVVNGLDVLDGILIENFKQSVDAMHVININALVGDGDAILNKAGGVIQTNRPVNEVHKRIEQPPVAKDIYALIDIWTQRGKGATGVQDIISGVGQAQAETLGEAEIVAGQAAQRMTDYIKSLEETLIEPLYDMRNQINMQFLDAEYVYGIIGEGAIDWRTIDPTQIRANVDFLCESSTRETNRTIITQQILQFIKMAPVAQASGIPLRFDKLFKRLCEQGFSWSEKQVEDIIPTLKLEKMGVDLDQLLLGGALQAMTLGTAAPMQQLGGSDPNPTNESDANQSMRQRNDTQIPRSA